MSLASNLLYMFGLLGAGLVARRLDLLTPTRADYLTRFAFYVALPALVFDSTATTDLAAVFSPRMIAAFVLTELAIAAIAWLVHRRLDDPAKRSVAIVQSYHGNFGYFPTYSLGSAMAAQLYAAAEADIGAEALEAGVREGDFDALHEWLTENVHRHGARYETNELVEQATGESFTADAFTDYVTEKYGSLYDLDSV